MGEIQERYQKIAGGDRSFDIQFWQAQGDMAIFAAVSDMIRDYYLVRGIDTDELRIERTVESFQKM